MRQFPKNESDAEGESASCAEFALSAGGYIRGSARAQAPERKPETDDPPPAPFIARAVSLSAEIVDAAIAAGVRLSVRDGKLAAGPRDALNHDLLRLLAENEAAIVDELRNRPEPGVVGRECSGCSNLKMRVEAGSGSRRTFWWRCGKGHVLMECHAFGERVMIAPADCEDYAPWRPGQ